MVEQFTFQEIENDPTIQKFLKKKSGRAPNTISNYIIVIRSFCNFTKKNPTEIHDLHREDLLNRVPEFNMWLNEALDDYVSHLTESNYKYGTIKHHITRIKGYFHAFKLKPTPEPIITKKHISEDSKYALTVEDIRKAVQNSNPTYQAFFITQAQTGLSLSDALLLDVADFVQAVSKKNENITINEAIYRVKTDNNLIGCFDLRRKKSSVEFYTFVGTDALRHMASLLESREERYLKLESPIFMKNTSRLSKSKEHCLKDLRLKSSSIKNYVDRMHRTKKIFPRIEVDGKQKNYFRTHKLRKWFSNQLRFKAGFNSDDTKYLMGQKTGDVLEQYIDTNNYTALKTNYRKALPYLAITEEVVMEENLEAIENLQKENQALKEQIRIKEEANEARIATLTAKLESSVEQMNVKVDDIKEAQLSLLDYETVNGKRVLKPENERHGIRTPTKEEIEKLEKLRDSEP